MRPDGLAGSLAAVGGTLLASAAAGWILARAIFPGGTGWRMERAGWGFGIGTLLTAANVPFALIFGLRPGIFSLLPLLAVAGALAWRFVLPKEEEPQRTRSQARVPLLGTLFLALTALGVTAYAVRGHNLAALAPLAAAGIGARVALLDWRAIRQRRYEGESANDGGVLGPGGASS